MPNTRRTTSADVTGAHNLQELPQLTPSKARCPGYAKPTFDIEAVQAHLDEAAILGPVRPIKDSGGSNSMTGKVNP
jgi:hypothetical protein